MALLRVGAALTVALALTFGMPVHALSASCPDVDEPSSGAGLFGEQNSLSVYRDWSDRDRRDLQWALIWVGHYSGRVDGIVGPSTLRAVMNFQQSLGRPATGVLAGDERKILFQMANANKARVGFAMFPDPNTGFDFDYPRKLVNFVGRSGYGSKFVSADNQLEIQTLRIKDGRTLCELFEKVSTIPRRRLIYQSYKRNHFVIKGTDHDVRGYPARHFFMQAEVGIAPDGSGSEIRAVSFSYPDRDAEKYHPPVVAMWNTFQPFDRDFQSFAEDPDQGFSTGRTQAGRPDLSSPPDPRPMPQPLERRVALVIGNSAYKNMSRLRNPGNDAQDMALELRRLGFDVTVKVDLSRTGLEKALMDFERQARDAETALIFFAGHALQHNGINYLAPVDASIESEKDLEFRFIKVQAVLEQFSEASRVRLLILDACRDNEAIQTLANLKPGNRSAGASRGLARISGAEGMLIAFATQPDRVAADGTGRNSPFTESLLAQLRDPGLPGRELRTLLTRVRAAVADATRRKQVPEVSDSLIGEFFFLPAPEPRRAAR